MGKNENAAEAMDLDFGANGVSAGTADDSLLLDLESVEEKEFEVIPKGSYQAVVESLEFGESKSNNPMITVEYTIVEGEYTDRKVRDYWVLRGNGSEFGLVKLKKFVARLCPDVSLAGFNPASFAESAVAVGRQCTIKLGTQKQKKGEYAGRVNNTVQEVDAPTSMY